MIVFPNAEAMQAHMQGLGEFPIETREYAHVENIQIYGQPNETNLETMIMIADFGTTLNIKPQAIGVTSDSNRSDRCFHYHCCL